jgi:drug/metabolite transporter (DMT)-like permease
VFLTALVILGLAPLAGLYAWELASGHGFALNATNFAAIGYVAIFPSVVAYLFWNRAVEEMGPNRTGHYLHLMPAFGVLFAIILLGERLYAFHLLGALLIAAGIVLATWTLSSSTRQRVRSRSDP